MLSTHFLRQTVKVWNFETGELEREIPTRGASRDEHVAPLSECGLQVLQVMLA